MNFFEVDESQRVTYHTKHLSKKKNSIKTTLYTFYNFFPLGLWNQIKKVSNMYFLSIAIIAIIPGIEAINTQAIFVPVAYVILFALFFDLWEDFKRFRQDRHSNQRKVRVI